MADGLDGHDAIRSAEVMTPSLRSFEGEILHFLMFKDPVLGFKYQGEGS